MTRHISKPGAASVPADTLIAMLEQVAEIGRDPGALVTRARVPFTLADLNEGKLTQVPRSSAVAVYRECLLSHSGQAARDAHSVDLPVGEFELMCHCMVSASSLGEAIERARDFFSYRDQRITSLEVTSRGRTAEFRMSSPNIRNTLSSFLTIAGGMAAFHRLFGWLIGGPVPLRSVRFVHDVSFRDHLFIDLFGSRMELGATWNGFEFPADLLRRRIVRSGRDMVGLLKSFPFDVLPPDYETGSLGQQIRALYRTTLAQGAALPTLEELARNHGLSVMTLRRRLAEEHESLRAIRAACRRDVTLDLLRHSDLPVEEVAARAGFRDMGSFRAAVRSWTGRTPSQLQRDPEPLEPGAAGIATALEGPVGRLLERSTLLILLHLKQQRLRAAELRRRLAALPGRPAQGLERLIRAGLVTPANGAGEHALTRLGRGCLEAAIPLCSWLFSHGDRLRGALVAGELTGG
jgi:AraC-like DNA-binding protein/DNA-binding HxlR family transcriptional regulator